MGCAVANDDSKEKRCFVICPIGERESAIRARSDDLYEHLIRPLAEQAGYRAERVIDNDRPGDITTKIVGDIIEADIIVADITGHNPNVFYELAIAHAWNRPCILLSCDDPVRIPFDIGSQNVIQIRHDSFAATQATRNAIERHFAGVGQGSAGQENPVARFERGKVLEQSADPMAREMAGLREEMDGIRSTLRELESSSDQRQSREILMDDGVLSHLVRRRGTPFADFLTRARQVELDLADCEGPLFEGKGMSSP